MNIKRFDKNHSVIARNAKPELSGFTQSSPGMLIQFVIFWLLFPAGSLVRERRQHNLDRLRATQITYSSILVGLVARKRGRSDHIDHHYYDANFSLLFFGAALVVLRRSDKRN